MKLRTLILLLALLALSTAPLYAAKNTITGVVTCNGKGVAGVVVSDGLNVVKTNAKGAYALPTDLTKPQSQFVHISIPSGYEVEREGNRPLFYGVINREAKGVQTFNFKLTKVDQSSYTLLAIADSHVCGGVNSAGRVDDREQYCDVVVPALNKQIAAHNNPVYICALGDMSQPKPRRLVREGKQGYSLNNYMEDTKVDRPIFNVIGNHDHNHAPKGTYFNDETVYQSRRDFNNDLGPAYYSFNIGREHYVVIDNTFVLTKDSGPTNDPNATKGYMYRLCNYQHEWLAADMAAVDAKSIDRVVLLAHCGLFGYGAKKQQYDLERLLDNFKGFEVVALIGHHHADHSIKKMWNDKPLYQFMHPSAAGTTWHSLLNSEGTPAAIVKYDFKDNNLTRTYIPYGEFETLNYRVYDNRNHKYNHKITVRTGLKNSHAAELNEASHKDKGAILVNIWNAYTCTFTESTGGTGIVTQRLFDPAFRDWYWDTLNKSFNEELPVGYRLKRSDWQRPKRNHHLWQYVPADQNATVHVVAKDAFGNIVAEFDAHSK